MFAFPQKVLFKHCDPAGIIFFPRYFEMINDCTEEFFATRVNWPFEQLLATGGIPTVSTCCKFTAPSRHGEHLLFTLAIERIGNTSIELEITACSGSEVRLINKSTLVRVDPSGRPERWPDQVRSRLHALMEGHHGT